MTQRNRFKTLATMPADAAIGSALAIIVQAIDQGSGSTHYTADEHDSLAAILTAYQAQPALSDRHLIQQVREQWISRADALQYKGKARDKACLEFLMGAMSATIMRDESGRDVSPLSGSAFLCSVRGARDFENAPHSMTIRATEDGATDSRGQSIVTDATREHETEARGWYTKPGHWRDLVRCRVRDQAA